MSTPVVSVLIPVYNRESYIGECVESALNQTFSDIEIVICDNASTDGTWEICQYLARQDSRVRIFRNETNLGPVRNWKRCIREGRGRYAKLLFSDDVMLPRYLEVTVPYMQDPNVGFAFSTVYLGEHIRHCSEAYKWRSASGRFSRSEYLEAALFGGPVPVSPCAGIFRPQDLDAALSIQIESPAIHDFDNHGAGPDLVIFLLTAHRYTAVAFIIEPLVFFREHNRSISVMDSGEKQMDRYRQARYWFAHRKIGEHQAEHLLIRYWLLDCVRERKLIEFSKVAEKYVHESGRPSRFYLKAAMAGFKLARQAFLQERGVLRGN